MVGVFDLEDNSEECEVCGCETEKPELQWFGLGYVPCLCECH